MEYTLGDILREGIVPSAQSLTAGIDPSAVPITYVSVQEAPAEDFVRPHELVLSTAVGCTEDEAALLNFVRTISDAKAAAILFSFKDLDFHLPQSVIRFAESARLPLYAIPWACRFSDIQAAVMQRILDSRLSEFKTLQTALTDCFFESRPIEDAAKLIGKHLRASVVIEGGEGQVLAQSLRTSIEDDTRWEEHIIQMGRVAVGVLRLGLSDTTLLPSGGTDRILEKYICFPLSLWFNRLRIEELAIVRVREDFVWNLADRNYESLAEMARQGLRLHFDLTRPYTCMAIKAARADDAGSEEDYSLQFAEVCDKIESELIRQGQEQQLSVIAAARSTDFVVFLENGHSQPEQDVARYMDKINEKLKKNYPAYRFYWGVSETNTKPPVFHRLYRNARIALQYAMSSERGRYCFTYRDTREAQVIAELSGSETVRRIAEEIIGPLREHDAASGMDLLDTLVAFIKCNCNISLTARTLYIHRTSLLYRLEKIELATGMSLKDPQDLFLLGICTRLYMKY